jgi:nucleotide-binding universal stress UspA family protein
MLETILVAADGSDHADKAIDWAIELATRHDAKLVPIFVAPHREVPPELRRMAEVEHIVQPGEVEAPAAADPLYPYGSLRPELERSLINSAAIYREIGERLLEAVRFRAEQRGVKAVEPLLEHGDPADQIVRAAERYGADLIVMGRRGVGDVEGLLLGWVSQMVCQLGGCACLTVK